MNMTEQQIRRAICKLDKLFCLEACIKDCYTAEVDSVINELCDLYQQLDALYLPLQEPKPASEALPRAGRPVRARAIHTPDGIFESLDAVIKHTGRKRQTIWNYLCNKRDQWYYLDTVQDHEE